MTPTTTQTQVLTLPAIRILQELLRLLHAHRIVALLAEVLALARLGRRRAAVAPSERETGELDTGTAVNPVLRRGARRQLEVRNRLGLALQARVGRASLVTPERVFARDSPRFVRRHHPHALAQERHRLVEPAGADRC